MRRALIGAALIGLLALVPAHAYFGSHILGFGANTTFGACSSVPVTFLSAQTSTADSNTYTFSGVSLGDVACSGNIRLIYVHSVCSTVGNNATVAITVGGQSATHITADTTSASFKTVTAQAQVNSGTTGDVVITYTDGTDQTCERIAVILYAVISTTGTRTDTVSDNSSTGDFDAANLATTSGGGVIFSLSAIPDSTCLIGTWGGSETITENVNSTIDAAIDYAGWSFTANATQTTNDLNNTSCTGDSDGLHQAASWEPPA